MIDVQHPPLYRLSPLALTLCAAAGFAQTDAPFEKAPDPEEHRDQPHEQFDPAGPDAADFEHQTGEPVQDRGAISPRVVRMRQVNVDPMGLDILGDAANEPSIAVDPTNRQRMAIGWRQFDTVLNSFRQAGVAYSSDGGDTWTNNGPIEPGLFRSDPVLEANSQGVFFYNSLLVEGGNTLTTQVFRSFDGGATWSDFAQAFGGDKQWMAIDRSSSPGAGHLYEIWRDIPGANLFTPNVFSRSIDNGASWQNPIQVPGSPEIGTLAVGPDGELYVVGFISGDTRGFVAKSTDASNALVTPSFTQTSLVPLGGTLTLFAGVNPQGLSGQLCVAVDHTSGPRRGWVYMVVSVNPPGADSLDTFFIRSTDGGVTWDAPVRLNDDVGTAVQWFGAMSVSESGRIDVIWNDTRDLGVPNSALYYTFSYDGGTTWAPNEQLTQTFNHSLGYPQQNKMGDYIEIDSDDSGADIAMTATFTGGQDVYYIRVDNPVCQPTSGRDCNGNGLDDACEIANDIVFDANANGIPDACETPVCLADTNRDGIVNFGDVTEVLSRWGDLGAPGAFGDADGDGSVAFNDLTVVLSFWLATCP